MACTATVIPTTQTYQVSTDYAGTRRAGNTPKQQPNSQLFCRPQPNGKPQVTALQNPYPRRSEPPIRFPEHILAPTAWSTVISEEPPTPSWPRPCATTHPAWKLCQRSTNVPRR